MRRNGYSVGRWDGDTLVVESYSYNDKTWLDGNGSPHTEALRVTERYRRGNFGHMDIEVTRTDAGAYARPLVVRFNADLEPTETPRHRELLMIQLGASVPRWFVFSNRNVSPHLVCHFQYPL
jgi:hypothetical protein